MWYTHGASRPSAPRPFSATGGMLRVRVPTHMTKAEHKRMRELQRQDSLTRAEHRELEELEDKWDTILEEEEEPEPEPKDPPEPEPKDPPEPEPKDPPEPEPKDPPEPEPKDPPTPAKIKPENDHWYFKDRGPFRKKQKTSE